GHRQSAEQQEQQLLKVDPAAALLLALEQELHGGPGHFALTSQMKQVDDRGEGDHRQAEPEDRGIKKGHEDRAGEREKLNLAALRQKTLHNYRHEGGVEWVAGADQTIVGSTGRAGSANAMQVAFHGLQVAAAERPRITVDAAR